MIFQIYIIGFQVYSFCHYRSFYHKSLYFVGLFYWEYFFGSKIFQMSYQATLPPKRVVAEARHKREASLPRKSWCKMQE